MVPFFPKPIANKGLLLYFISVITISVVFGNYAMNIAFLLMGIVGVFLFFYGSNHLTVRWQNLPPKAFLRRLFWTALIIRLAWVVFSYFFYETQTGKPFEFDAADSLAYHGEGEWLAAVSWREVFDYLFWSRSGYSDSGYCLYLTLVYKIFGINIIIPRILKALYSSFSCVLIYKLVARSINDKVARMAAVIAMLMPNLIVYCGLHLKETEMLFLIVVFLERADYVLRSRKITFINIVLPVILAMSLFLFRTVLGVVAFFSFVTALFFSPNRVLGKGRKFMIAFWVVLAIVILAGGAIMNEIEETWLSRGANQETKRLEQTIRGNQWAKYATGTVMAPMVFVLPFSSMVDTDQRNQLVLHGGNYVRNFMGVFALVALVSALFIKKNWRDFSLIGSFVIGYLGVISLSGFANSERFLLPGLPGLIIFWAYGMSVLNAKSYRFVKYWYVVVPVMEIGWAVFKIGSRGLL
jgi:hypothetical protein